MYRLFLDVDEMGAFGSLNEVDIHFINCLQLRLADWDIFITVENGWGCYDLQITPDHIKIGDLVIFEYADLLLNGVRFLIDRL
jgi:hypothetical protein